MTKLDAIGVPLTPCASVTVTEYCVEGASGEVGVNETVEPPVSVAGVAGDDLAVTDPLHRDLGRVRLDQAVEGDGELSGDRDRGGLVTGRDLDDLGCARRGVRRRPGRRSSWRWTCSWAPPVPYV